VVDYEFNDLLALAQALEAADEERELDLPLSQPLRDGEWLLATFAVGDRTTSVAGRVVVRDDSLRLSFESRDWHTLCKFAGAECCACSERASLVPCPRLSDESPPHCNVLIVDDDAGVQAVVTATLRASGFCARAVGSAEEALDYMRSAPVDLLVADVRLPGMTGLELCRRMRKDRRLAQVPVVFLSAESSDRQVVEAFDAGADDFVSKPFRAPELGARLLSVLRRSGQTLRDAS
jgi:two-component system phosphate regulon response regulator PhoB